MSSETQRKTSQLDKSTNVFFCCYCFVIHGQKSISNPAAHKRQAVHLCGMKQLFTKMRHSFWRKSQLIRVRRSRHACFWPSYSSTWENSTHFQHLINKHRERQWCNQMLRATYVSFALFIIWNKVIQCVQWGRWWSLTELFLHLPKWGLNGKHGASRILLYVKASVKRRWLMKRDVHLPQIGRFQFSNTDFHIHYWTQAFSFDCYYTCLIFTLQLVWIFTWSLSVAVLCSYCGVRVLHLWDKIYKWIASVCSDLQK